MNNIDKFIHDYREIEKILSHMQSLSVCGIGIKFEKDCMRVTEVQSKAVNTNESFYTARELLIYLRGLEDGAHGVGKSPQLKQLFARD